MVAIFTGAGTGFERGSGNVIGAGGLLGSAAQGRGGDNIFLNAANGNLMINRQDEFLSGRGPDAAINRTYNSLGNFTDDNGDNWRQSMDRRVFGLTGTANTSGSKVKRRGADGAEVSYDWNGSTYVATDGGGSYDTLSYNGTEWTWTDGDSQVTEVYSAYGSEWRIASQTDTSGNSLTFSYTGANLTRATTANGEYTEFAWSGSNITQIVTGYSEGGVAKTLTRTRYSYDGDNRLSTVTVDLTPNDNSVTDSNVYTTTYTYHGSSKLVATIAQTDGSHVAFTYDGSNRVESIAQTVSTGVTRTTTIAYGSGSTTITDPMGQVTTLHYDANGQLIRVTAPPVSAGAAPQTVEFGYNANGDLIRMTDAGGKVTSYTYDASGNLLTRSDAVSVEIQSGLNAIATLQPDGTYRITKTGGSSGSYDAQVQSVTGLSGDFVFRLRPLQANKYLMAGVSQNPNASTSYTNLDFAIEAADNGNIYTYAGGSGALLTSYVAGDNLWMVRTGSTISYYKGATIEAAKTAGALRTLTGVSGTFYFCDAALYDVGATADVSLTATSLAESFNVVTRTYNAANQLLTETRTGSDKDSAAAAQTTRYVYDSQNRLTYVVSAEGQVVRSWYNSYGQLYQTSDFPDHAYDVSGLSASTSIAKATLDSWATGLGDTSSAQISYSLFDARGNISRRTASSQNASYATLGSTDYRNDYFVYDQAGQLLTRQTPPQIAEYFAYDGLGRVTSSTDLHGGTTTILFNDAATQTTVMLANGLVQVSTYSKSGELLSFNEGGAYTVGGTATYAYDQNGRLRAATDATGTARYYLYDQLGRKTADVNEYGDLTEYRYDSRNRLVATVHYAGTVAGAHLTQLANPASTLDIATIRPTTPNSADIWTWQIYDADGRVLQAIDGDGSTTRYEYDASGRLVQTIGYYNKLSATQLTALRAASPTSLVLPTAHTKDTIARIFYDKDGRTIGALDSLGYLTRVLYDKAGRKVQEIAYASPTGSALRASGTFQQLLDSAGTSAADRSARHVYDGQGLLRFQIDGLGQVVEYGYDSGVPWGSIGLTRKEVRYATALGSLSSYTYASVKAAVAATAGMASHADNRVSWTIYDLSGRIAYTIDATGAVNGFQYDQMGQVTKQVAYATLRETTALPTQADMNSWAGSSVTAADRVTRFYYDARGQLRFTVDPEAYLSRTDYDAAGRATLNVRWDTPVSASDSWTIGNAFSAQTGTNSARSYEYDDAGRLVHEDDAEGNRTRYQYSATGLLTQVTLAFGTADASITTYAHDAMGRVISQTSAAGTAEAVTTASAYDGLGNLISVTDPLNRTTSYTHDKLGRILTQTDAASGVVSYQYNAFGEVNRVTDALGHSSYSYYDKLGRAIITRDAENYVTETSYTRFGEVDTVTRRYSRATNTASVDLTPAYVADTRDAITSYEYDKAGRATVVQDAENDATQTSYTRFGEIETVTRDGAVTRFTYDKLSRVTRSTDALGHYEEYTLDAHGNRLTVRNKAGGITTNSFDRRGLLTQESIAISGDYGSSIGVQATTIVNTFEYDARGNLTRKIEADNAASANDKRITSYTYDKLDRLTSKSGVPVATGLSGTMVTPAESYAYDKNGNLIETRAEAVAGVKRTLISRTLFYYDDLNRKVAEIGPMGAVQTHGYDLAGNLTTARAYDNLVDPASLTAGAALPVLTGSYRETTYQYDALSRLHKTIALNTLSGSWNGSSYVITTSNPTPDYLVTEYGYDAAGNVIRTTGPDGSIVYSYYDKAGRKTAQVDQENYLTSWTYDTNGNVLSERRHATRWTGSITTDTVPAVGTASADRVTEFTYDTMGRRLTETRKNVEAWSIGASNGALTSATGDARIVYTYTKLGQVESKEEANGDKTRYTYDTAGRLIVEKRASYTDHSGAAIDPTLRYFYDKLDQLTLTRQGSFATASDDRITTNSYTAGRLSSTTNAAGFVRSYHYDAAGRVVAESYDRLLSSGSTVKESLFYVHDAAGRVITQTHARYNGTNWVHTDADVDGHIFTATRTRYNAHGELTGRGTTLGHTVAAVYQEYYDYDALGRMWRTNSGDGVLKFQIYDKAGRQTLMLSSAGADFSLRDLSNYASQLATDLTNTDRVVTITAYDKRGMVTQTRAPNRELNATTVAEITGTREYNAFGEVVSETDTFGKTTSLTYNAMGRLLRKEGPAVEVTYEHGGKQWIKPSEDYYYDISGRLIGTRDANGSYGSGGTSEGSPAVKQANSGNLSGRVLLAGTGHGGGEALAATEFRADGHAFRTLYDKFGDARILRNELYDGTNASQTDETYNYDAMGRVTSVVRRGALLTEYYDYDGLGQNIRQWNSIQGSGNKALTDYDAQGRIVVSVAIGGDTTTTRYEWSGALTTTGMGTFGGWIQTTSTDADRASGTDGIIAAVQRTDLFGRVAGRTDKGGLVYSYQYDLAGRMLIQTSILGEVPKHNDSYSYYNTGQTRQVITGDTPVEDTNWSRKIASYEYDALGRVTREHLKAETGKYTPGEWVQPGGGPPQPLPSDPEGEGWTWVPPSYSISNELLQDGRAEYDAAGRITRYRDVLSITADAVDKKWDYDAVGNVRSISTAYIPMQANGAISGTAPPQTYWYRYDSMSRLVTTKGSFVGTAGSGYIERGTAGTDLTYDDAGRRMTAQTGTNAQESYSYSATGQITSMKIGSITRAETYYDALGRVSSYAEYGPLGTFTTAVYSRHDIVYDLRGQVLAEKSSTKQGDDWIYTHTVNNYSATGAGTSSPAITSSGQIGASSGTLLYYSETKNWKNGSASPVYGSTQDFDYADSYTYQTYEWRDTARQSIVELVNRDGASTSSYGYDRNGTLIGVYIAGGSRPRSITYTTNQQGQIIARKEKDGDSSKNDPSSRTYMFGGRQMGMVGNDGTGNLDYAASIAARTAAPSSDNGAFRNGSNTATIHADFDSNFTAFNGGTVSGGSSSYVASAGETLQSIAAQQWGDASLWYKLAEGNPGLGSGALAAGTPLSIPGGVIGNHHNADTFKPYDPAEAIGNISPNTPQPPKKNNCGIMGQVILAAIAIAITVIAPIGGGTIWATMGNAALGSIVSQTVGVASGIQDKFSFKSVAISALSAGMAPGNTGNFIVDAIRHAVTNAAVQGIAVVTGLQHKFDWAGVAAAGIGGAVGGQFGDKAVRAIGKTATRVAAGTAASIAAAATRSAITGSSFGDSLKETLPSVVGQIFGSILQGNGDPSAAAKPEGEEKRTGLLGGIIDFAEDALELPGKAGNSIGRTIGSLVAEGIASIGKPGKPIDLLVQVKDGSYSASTNVAGTDPAMIVQVRDPETGQLLALDASGNLVAAPEFQEATATPSTGWGEKWKAMSPEERRGSDNSAIKNAQKLLDKYLPQLEAIGVDGKDDGGLPGKIGSSISPSSEYVRRQVADLLVNKVIPDELNSGSTFGKQQTLIGEIQSAAYRALNGRQQMAFEYLTSSAGGNWSDAAAVGVIASLTKESFLDPGRRQGDYLGTSGPGVGLAQWELGDPRVKLYNSLPGNKGYELGSQRVKTDYQVGKSAFFKQLSFINYELTNPQLNGAVNYVRAGDILRKARTATEASEIVVRKYESPRHVDMEVKSRRPVAIDIWNNFVQKKIIKPEKLI
ncbi:phage tail tip lysozyme [Sphingomonas koreensis]